MTARRPFSARRVPANAGRALTKYWQLYAMLALPLAFVFVFNYMVYPNLRIAFMNYRPARGWSSDWVGLGTFAKVFKDADFHRAFRNTLLFNIADIILQFPAPIILALMINELKARRFKRVSQTVLYLPHFLSSVIVASVAYTLFKPETGLVNVLLMNWGVISKGIPFLTEKWRWVFTYLSINIWQQIGWSSIIYLAAITSIDPSLYEAATVDGAGRFKRLWHITLTGIRPTIVMLLIMRLGQLLGSGFERLNAFGNVNVREFQYQLSIYVYEKGLGAAGDFSRSTAVGLFQTLVGLAMVFISDRFAKLLGEDGLV
ncbi:MAG: ABC transporter permease subunit [Oscillospiraceae bacterium]|jgi:putative aldouronate transport system permease protein|nr:ABC transporter permease subunit [Oscillospiraceae bacterium]